MQLHISPTVALLEPQCDSERFGVCFRELEILNQVQDDTYESMERAEARCFRL